MPSLDAAVPILLLPYHKVQTKKHAGATSGHERARTQVFTRIIKVPVHKAHAQNEAADAAASLAAEEADEETALSHAASQAIRLILQGRLT
jgi:ribonuclease HI